MGEHDLWPAASLPPPLPASLDAITCTLRQKISRSACVAGESFGCTPSGIWVSSGCRGHFTCERNGSQFNAFLCGSGGVHVNKTCPCVNIKQETLLQQRIATGMQAPKLNEACWTADYDHHLTQHWCTADRSTLRSGPNPSAAQDAHKVLPVGTAVFHSAWQFCVAGDRRTEHAMVCEELLKSSNALLGLLPRSCGMGTVVENREGEVMVHFASDCGLWGVPMPEAHWLLEAIQPEVPRNPQPARRLQRAQQRIDQAVYRGKWEQLKWIPFEEDHPWNQSALMRRKNVVVLGASPMRQLAYSFSSLITHNSTSARPRLSHASGCAPGYTCTVHQCDARLARGCTDCFCCCTCHLLHKCSSQDVLFEPNATAAQDAHAPGTVGGGSLEYSGLPELVHADSDRTAFATRFCRKPPDLLIISKGVHDSYFDIYTLLPNRASSINFSQPMENRVPVQLHLQRMMSAVAAYVEILSCLPETTVVVWLTPYHSIKAPWQGPLVWAARQAMLRLRQAGAFHSVLFVDSWHLSYLGGMDGPHTVDGNHYQPRMQDLMWHLVAHAYEWATADAD